MTINKCYRRAPLNRSLWTALFIFHRRHPHRLTTDIVVVIRAMHTIHVPARWCMRLSLLRCVLRSRHFSGIFGRERIYDCVRRGYNGVRIKAVCGNASFFLTAFNQNAPHFCDTKHHFAVHFGVRTFVVHGWARVLKQRKTLQQKPREK